MARKTTKAEKKAKPTTKLKVTRTPISELSEADLERIQGGRIVGCSETMSTCIDATSE